MLKLLISSALMFSFAAHADLMRDPVGEEANYTLDRDRARTTGMIKKGKVDAKVMAYVPDAEDGPAYSVRLAYDLTISFVGRKQGVEDILAPEQYFKPEFLETLRRDKDLDLETFKVKHLGFATVRNQNGKRYENTDKILIYDVKQTQNVWSGMLREALTEVASVYGVTSERIENLKVLVHVKEGLPVLGAVKIDISGRARGYNFKAGFDLR